MKIIFKAILIIVLVTALLLGSLAIPASEVKAQVLFDEESWNDFDVPDGPPFDTSMSVELGQTFQALEDHTLTSVSLKLFSEGVPGPLYVFLREGVFGNLLASGEIDGNTLVPTYPGQWYDIPLIPESPGSELLIAGSTYSIAIHTPTVNSIAIDAPASSVTGAIYWISEDLPPPFDYPYGDAYWNFANSAGSGWSPIAPGLIDFKFEIYGDFASYINGTTSEVNCQGLSSVLVEVYEGPDFIRNAISDGSGNYSIPVIPGDYDVIASKSGYRNETQSVSVGSGTYTIDFVGEHGLVPNAPSVSYVLGCINHWLYPVSPCGLSMSRVLAVINAWLYPQ